MSRLERELRSQSLRSNQRSGSKTPTTRARAGSKTPTNNDSDFENDELENEVNDLNFNRLDELLRSQIDQFESEQLSKEFSGTDQQPQTANASSRSNSTRAVDSKESRSNSILASLITTNISDESRSASNTSNATSLTPTKSSIPDIITTLSTKSRSRLPTTTRIFLYNQLFKLLITAPDLNNDHNTINDRDLGYLVECIKTSRDNLEFIVGIRCAVSYCCSNVDEVASDAIEVVFPVLLAKIYENSLNNKTNGGGEGSTGTTASASGDGDVGTSNNSVIATCITAYASLLLVIFDESSCYGLEDNIDSLLTLCESYTSNLLAEDEEAVIASALNAIGVVVTLLFKSGRSINEIIQEQFSRLLSFLTDDYSKKIQKSAGILIAIMYESFNWLQTEPEDEDEEFDPDNGPYYDTDELKVTLTRLVKESSKKISKKDKKESRSIFREVLKTVELYSLPPVERLKLIKRSDEDDSNTDGLALSQFKLSKSKALKIKTWFEYIRLIHLKFIFDSELNLQYLNSKEIRNLLLMPTNDGTGKTYRDELNDDWEHDPENKDWKDSRKNTHGMEKELKIKDARELKVREQFGDLSMDNDD